MRICYASDCLPNYHNSWGGAEQACLRLSKLLKNNGHEVPILASRPSMKVDDSLHFSTIPTIEDRLHMVHNILRNVKSALFPYDFISHVSSYKTIKRIRPDVLHIHNAQSLSLSLVLSANKLGIPVIISAYDYWFLCPLGFLWAVEDYTSYEGQPCSKFHGAHCAPCMAKARKLGLMQRYSLLIPLLFRKRLFDFFLNRIDKFVVLSPANATVLENYGIRKNNIHVVHIPLSEETVAETHEIEENSILYVGWLHPRKGPHIAVEAMPYVLQKIPDAKLYVIGEEANTEYVRRIRNSIRQNKLERSIFLLGRKPYSEVRQFVQTANVLVIPEQWETIAPNALTEGMVLGKTLVGSRMGGMLDFVRDGENGLLANVNDPYDLAEKIIMILEDKSTQHNLSEQARKSGVKLFSEERVYQQLLDLYQSLIP